jgi:N-methylhydantoinase B
MRQGSVAPIRLGGVGFLLLSGDPPRAVSYCARGLTNSWLPDSQHRNSAQTAPATSSSGVHRPASRLNTGMERTTQATSHLTQLSPATVAVVQHAFISGAEQMKRNLYRSAYSPVIYEMKDCAVGIFDQDGQLLGQAPGLPFFLGSLGGTVQRVIELVGRLTFQPEDVWIVNDSAICGSHLNDVTVIKPIFVDGMLRGFSGAKAHWIDVGAMRAGQLADSTDIFQEGLRIPPTRIVQHGVLDEQLLELIALNSRFPSLLVGDLKAEMAACHTGAERFGAIVSRYGWPLVERAIVDFFARAEAGDRRVVAAIPDGTYAARAELDGDPTAPHAIRIVVTVVVEGEEMTVDLEGSSPEYEGSVNSGLVQTRSAIQQAFKFLVNPDADACGGNFRNLTIKVPKGSCLDPSPTAACFHYGPHLMLAMDLMVKAVSAAVPDRATAGHVGDSWNVGFVNERGGPPFSVGESLVGGWGAYSGSDGESALIHSAAGDFRNFPVETMEQRYPLRIHKYALRDGSGGAGEFVGGMGIVREYESLVDTRLGLWFDRSRTPSWGLQGGSAGAAPEVWVTIPGEPPQMLLKVTDMRAPAGTRVLVRTGGGGGWGPAASPARGPEISPWK